MSGIKGNKVGSWVAITLIFLFCISLFPNPANAQEILDSNTQRNGMRACPSNLFIKGLDIEQNVLLCGSPPAFGAVVGPEFIDGDDEVPTQINLAGTTMHRCPKQSALTGIDVRRDDFLCQGYIPSNNNTVLTEIIERNLPTTEVVTYPVWCPFSGICRWAASTRTISNSRRGVRACDSDKVLVGLQPSSKEFACGQIKKTLGDL